MLTTPLTNINSINGENLGGICYFEFFPKEWLLQTTVIDPGTMQVNTSIVLDPSKAVLRADCLFDSMEYKEKPKTGRSGPYFEKSLTGLINKDTPEVLAQLNTLRYHELIVVYYDRNNQAKIIGDQESAMRLSAGLIVEKEIEGKSYYDIELSMESEYPSPFYIFPDGSSGVFSIQFNDVFA